MTAKVLVSGAAGGQQGSTGNRVTHLLLGKGIPVRALVHSDDERADALRRSGAEVIVGDLTEIASVHSAMAGVRRAFFTYPVADGLLTAAAAFAAAAREHRLEQIVAVSMLTPGPDQRTPRLRQHWLAEQVFDWANVGAVHLRAPVFFENVRALIDWRAEPASLAIPLGTHDTILPLVGAEDVARVAAGILAGASVHEPGPVRLVGELTTVGGAVKSFDSALDRPLRYLDIPDEAWHKAALDGGLNAHAAAHLTQLWELFRTGGAQAAVNPAYQVTDAIERLGGNPPLTFETFLRAQRDALPAA